MLDDIRAEQSELHGTKVKTAISLTSLILCAVMLLLGIGVIRGLITSFSFYEYDGSQTNSVELRGFNVWILLAVTIGLQWLFIIIGALSYFLWRKWSGAFNVFEIALSAIIKKFSGLKTPAITAGEYRKVWKWRLTRILQAGGIAYNAGLIIGLFGCLWFLKVGYYWETSLPQFGEESLKSVTAFLSSPTGQYLPTEQAINYTNLGATVRENMTTNNSLPARDGAFISWSAFFFIALAIWGLLPRLLFWIGSIILERKSCANLSFQESHHRALWRDITKVQRGEVNSSPADGVVLLDIGGLEIETDTLRPFLLQELRVNPESRFSLGTLDEDGERKGLIAAKAAAMGVVFIVEGWNLSPKQMTIYHDQVRSAIGAGHMIRYLVIGEDAEQHQQWTSFIDSMKDAETEIYQFSKKA